MSFEPIYTEKERSKKIKTEQTRLDKIFKDLDCDAKGTIKKLISEAAFMAVTLEETRLIIARDGIIEEYQNGANQKGLKKSSAVEVYDRMINTYAKIIKQLCDALPNDKKSVVAEEIKKFISDTK
jgi:transcription elongation factor Elf1